MEPGLQAITCWTQAFAYVCVDINTEIHKAEYIGSVCLPASLWWLWRTEDYSYITHVQLSWCFLVKPIAWVWIVILCHISLLWQCSSSQMKAAGHQAWDVRAQLFASQSHRMPHAHNHTQTHTHTSLLRWGNSWLNQLCTESECFCLFFTVRQMGKWGKKEEEIVWAVREKKVSVQLAKNTLCSH